MIQFCVFWYGYYSRLHIKYLSNGKKFLIVYRMYGNFMTHYLCQCVPNVVLILFFVIGDAQISQSEYCRYIRDTLKAFVLLSAKCKSFLSNTAVCLLFFFFKRKLCDVSLALKINSTSYFRTFQMIHGHLL